MKRRNFIHQASIGAILPAAALTPTFIHQSPSREWYEWRVYDIKFGGNQGLLNKYLNDTLKPALLRAGANHFSSYMEMGLSTPSKLHVLISYPGMEIFEACQQLNSDSVYATAAEAYNDLPIDQNIYTRINSSLLHAFDGLPQMLVPPDTSDLFELRIYEGYSEDAVRRKIKMFNQEEIEVFYKTGLNPVFFGEMVIGPYRPCLVYMLHFRDMNERDANWQKFVQHPDWITMRDKPEYANTVNNIRRIFLNPA